jgi:hypothetical protein
VILLNMMTLDGFFDGPGEGFEKIDWHHADEEWENDSASQSTQSCWARARRSSRGIPVAVSSG